MANKTEYYNHEATNNNRANSTSCIYVKLNQVLTTTNLIISGSVTIEEWIFYI